MQTIQLEIPVVVCSKNKKKSLEKNEALNVNAEKFISVPIEICWFLCDFQFRDCKIFVCKAHALD